METLEFAAFEKPIASDLDRVTPRSLRASDIEILGGGGAVNIAIASAQFAILDTSCSSRT